MSCIRCSPLLGGSGRIRIAADPILLIGHTTLPPLLAGTLTLLADSIRTSSTPQRTELTTAPPLAPSSHGPAILGPATRASEGLAARLCISMAGVSTQPSATVRAPSRPPRWGSPSRSWNTMDCVADHGSLHFVFRASFSCISCFSLTGGYKCRFSFSAPCPFARARESDCTCLPSLSPRLRSSLLHGLTGRVPSTTELSQDYACGAQVL